MLLTTALFLLGTPACSLAAMTGDMMSDYTLEHMNPYILGTSDVDMGCMTAVAMGPYLLSFERVTDPPYKAGISPLFSAAGCAEEHAWQEELRGLRGMFEGNAPQARDARIAEKRAHAVAATRYQRAYHSMVAAYGEPGTSCPELEEERDEVLWLMGLLGGVLAVQHDRASGGQVSVPMDVLPKAARGAACLDSASWWGVPDALRATVWLSVPGTGPQGADPWSQLDAAVALGERGGIRLSSAMFVQAALNVGDESRVRQGIARFAGASANKASRHPYQMFDAVAERRILAASDRLWTEGSGHRTPVGSLGLFHDSPSTSSGGDDDLLDDLGAAEGVADPPSTASEGASAPRLDDSGTEEEGAPAPPSPPSEQPVAPPAR